MSNPLSPSSSRLSKPNASRTPPVKNARHRRSKSNLPQPKILPFPDLSELRSSRDTSRANSPLSTPAGDRLDITFDQLIMVRGNSSDSGTHARQRSSGSGGRTTPVSVSGTSTFLRPTSPPTSSPLAVTSSRARAFYSSYETSSQPRIQVHARLVFSHYHVTRHTRPAPCFVLATTTIDLCSFSPISCHRTSYRAHITHSFVFRASLQQSRR